MRRADFFRLSRRLQERFIGATAGGPPAPLLYAPIAVRSPALWGILGVGSLGAMGWLAAWGFGRLGNFWAIAPPWMIAVYGLLGALAIGCWLAMLYAFGRSRGLPYRPGLYLFPIGVVRASGARLDIVSWAELRQREILPSPARLRLVFQGGGRFEFPLTDESQGVAVMAQVGVAAQRHAQAEQTGNRRELSLLDPLLDDGIPSPLLSDIPLRQERTWWARVPWWVGLVLGVCLGYPLWLGRNHWAERALFAAAVRDDSPQAYLSFLSAAGPHREVSRVLLPRSELRVAERTGLPEAVEKVARRYPDADIRSEFDQALRRTLLLELERVRRENKPGALRRFSEEQPRRELVAKEIEAALHDLYRVALGRYQAEAEPRHPELASVMKRLLVHAERHGARVEIRFVRKRLTSVGEADQRVLTSPYADRTASLPSQYFDGDHALGRERRAARTLGQRFARTVSPDLLSFELGPPLPEAEADAIKPKVPTLIIEHTTLMNGIFVNPSPPGVFVGVGILFRAVLLVPAGPTTEAVKWSFWQAPDLDRIKSLSLGARQVYEEMGSFAFDQFCAKYLATWFKSP